MRVNEKLWSCKKKRGKQLNRVNWGSMQQQTENGQNEENFWFYCNMMRLDVPNINVYIHVPILVLSHTHTHSSNVHKMSSFTLVFPIHFVWHRYRDFVVFVPKSSSCCVIHTMVVLSVFYFIQATHTLKIPELQLRFQRINTIKVSRICSYTVVRLHHHTHTQRPHYRTKTLCSRNSRYIEHMAYGQQSVDIFCSRFQDIIPFLLRVLGLLRMRQRQRSCERTEWSNKQQQKISGNNGKQ